MNKLIFFEIEKIWRKRSFIISVVSILAINIFLLWYTNLNDSDQAELNAYKAFQKDINKRSEEEKYEYVEKLYQDIQGVVFVEEVLNIKSYSGEIGEELANQQMNANPGMFEKYYDSYEKGDYLKYTRSMSQEESLITEIYEEMIKVSGYKDYLEGVQGNKDKLKGISIFAATQEEDNFSSRNIEKSAEDYSNLGDIKIHFYPSRGIVSAMQNSITDVLLMLSVFLFLGSLIYEEKEKRLFYITRAARLGRGKSIMAKLVAMAVNCIVMAVLLYGANLLFFACTTGLGDLFRSIQSVAPFMESNLEINVLVYIVLCILTKGMVLFAIGAILILTAIISKQNFVPYMTGAVIFVTGVLLYRFVPAYSTWNWLKYLNVIGLLETQNIYGGYLNFNFFGFPASRLVFSWIALILYVVAGVILSILAFLKCTNMEIHKIRWPFARKFKSHNNMLRHEGYKIFVMNRAGIIVFIFIILIGYQHLSKQCNPSVQENYYQSIMMQLEGKLTTEKIALIEAENTRYQQAFDKIDEIYELVASGEIDENTGDSMKTPYYSELAFYPTFERVLNQYEFVKETDGEFIYDTGYLYLLGVIDNGSLMDLILLSLCIILGFGNVMSMEYEKKSWYLLSATAKGKKQIIRNKKIVCITGTVFLSFVPWFCRWIQFGKYYPMNGLLTSLLTIPAYRETGLHMPVLAWLIINVFVQALTLVAIAYIVFFLSDKIKMHLQTLFVATLLLVIPLIFHMMGFEVAQWASFLPSYTMSGFILTDKGFVIALVYVMIAAIFVLYHMVNHIRES